MTRTRVGRPDSKTHTNTFAGRIGCKLRERRRAAGLTLQEMASRTDGVLSAAMISQYEMGYYEPRVGKLIAMCIALGASLDEVMPEDVRKLFARKPRPDQLSYAVSGSQAWLLRWIAGKDKNGKRKS